MRPTLIILMVTSILCAAKIHASALLDDSLFISERKGDLLYCLAQEDNKTFDLRIWCVVVTPSFIQGQGKSGTPGIKQEAIFSNDDRIYAIERLLKEGADINARDPETGCTALDMAISLNYRQVIWFLINDQNGNKLNMSSIKTAITAAEISNNAFLVLRLTALRETIDNGAKMADKTHGFFCEVVQRNGHDELLRAELICLLNDTVIPIVHLNNTPIVDAINWLATCKQQTIKYLALENNTTNTLLFTNRTVSLSMTNAPFLKILDKICEQSDRYWGFNGRVLMTLPKRFVQEKSDWIIRKNE